MSIFKAVDFDGHEELHFFNDQESGLKAIIAFHRRLPAAPSGGGIRMWPYPSEEAAVADALRLSRAMTYKLAVSGIRIGSAKSVIIGDPRKDKTEALLRAFGRVVESFGGRYFCAEDIGIVAEDLTFIAQETTHVVGLPGQDPSPGTALGILVCLRAAVTHRLGRDSLEGTSVAVQGLGDVGYNLCRLLRDAGAHLVVSDIVGERVVRAVTELGATAVDPEALLFQDVDVLAPCALGEVVNDLTIDKIRAKVICGGANNLLAEPRHGERLAERSILFVPDYLSNSGGVITVAAIRAGQASFDAERKIDALHSLCLNFFAEAERAGISANAGIARFTDRLILDIYGNRSTA
ncbi:Glu/Leu/Phe/Val dehydrogenase dimerization domain-containing protein [Limibacillus sp. MBR-115]|jgi:leucine dehydrogenase|uniref:Glu/Leu/Phe/Val dehydrogenase dimerization domain-containing protein n=1 Tax=Limibacillus sp. MBR-115 TaxID=3156465 RepID=UPI003397F48F